MTPRDETIKVIVNGQKIEFSIQEELTIDRHDIDSEILRQSAHYAWFEVMRERCRAEKVQAEADLDDLTYDLDEEVRSELRAENPKLKLTETAVKNAIRRRQEYRSAYRRIMKLEEYDRLLLSMVKALEQRKEMLKEVSRSRHIELSGLNAEEVDRIKSNLGMSR